MHNIMKNIFLVLSIILFAALGLHAQAYHLGQVITNPDGSQGVVFYVDETGSSGWMVALHDVALSVPWGLEDEIEGLDHVINTSNDILTSAFADTDGFANTQSIINHYQANGYTGEYAASMVDIENGWYLPAAGQLKMLYVNAIFYEPTLETIGEKLGLHPYWSSTQENTERAWFVHFGSPYPESAWAWNAYIGVCPKTNTSPNSGGYFAIRPIRDLELSPLPIIGHLFNPAVICNEGPLELVLPNLNNADSHGWEIAENMAFTNPIAYTGQDLDVTYNGWYLRLWATNEEGTSYSNAVRISVHETNSGFASVSSCEPYEWNGQIYNESGTYQAILVNQWGCDSIATIELTVSQPDEYFIPYPVFACDTYQWGDMTLTESGAYTQTFTNQHGCDSIVTMSLYINHSVEHQFSYTCCGAYNWNGQIYTESGVYQQTFLSANNCDSIVTLHLNIIDAYDFATDTTACESVVWFGQEYAQSGHYEQFFVASNGCDSIFSLNLTIMPHPEPISEIIGLQQIFVSTDLVQREYRYYIDSVPFVVQYEWSCENPDWILETSGTHCTLNATSPGLATLKVKAWNDCGYTEKEILIQAGFYDVDDNLTLPVKLYPNPANDKVHIEAEGMISVSLFDLFGQCLLKKDSEANDTMEIDINSFDSSVYVIEILTKQGRIVRKLNITR